MMNVKLACWSDDVSELERRLESGADTDDGRATVEEQVERKHRTSSLQHRQGNRRHQTLPPALLVRRTRLVSEPAVV